MSAALALYKKTTSQDVKIEESVPFIRAGDGYKFLLKIYALIIGFKHLSEPDPVFYDIIKVREMAIF